MLNDSGMASLDDGVANQDLMPERCPHCGAQVGLHDANCLECGESLLDPDREGGDGRGRTREAQRVIGLTFAFAAGIAACFALLGWLVWPFLRGLWSQ